MSLRLKKKRKIDDDGDYESSCPYLDTVDRSRLDFDFEKRCSVTMVNVNVYGCLVCGEYFNGRGEGTPAYNHSLAKEHHVFINLTRNQKIYCLPDNYEIIDSSLNDIKYLANPSFTLKQIQEMDNNDKYVKGLDGKEYLPGFVGLNQIKHSDCFNVVFQLLVHVPNIRNFFLIHENYERIKSPLIQRFGELVRKMYNPMNFKGQVSPHELLQAIQASSNLKFKVGQLFDPIDILHFLLNKMSNEINADDNIFHSVFRGEILVTSSSSDDDDNGKEKIRRLPFYNLSVELPPQPLFKTESEKNSFSQVSLMDLLRKFDNRTEKIMLNGETMKYSISKLPKYLILHIKRFVKNNFFIEKNNTIVNFDVNSLNLRPYTTKQEKDDVYDLVGVVNHEGSYLSGQFEASVLHKSLNKWYKFRDLHVTETFPQLISLSETYIHIYCRREAIHH